MADSTNREKVENALGNFYWPKENDCASNNPSS